LQLSDFDWGNGVFTVRRSKKGGLQQFPLRPEVSESVLAYIKNTRPQASCTTLFLSFHPPFGPMHLSSVYEIVSLRLKQLNIKTQRRGPHSLRHAAATELLRRGSSPREIADFLGHRTTQSVGIYARFDMQSLRKVSDLDLSGALSRESIDRPDSNSHNPSRQIVRDWLTANYTGSSMRPGRPQLGLGSLQKNPQSAGDRPQM
jgi:integrase/recombinase XerD